MVCEGRGWSCEQVENMVGLILISIEQVVVWTQQAEKCYFDGEQNAGQRSNNEVDKLGF
jgi:hypothetical protein